MSQVADILLRYLGPVAIPDQKVLQQRLTVIEQNAYAMSTRMGVRGEVNSLSAGNVSIDYTEGVTLRNPTTSKRTIYLDPDGDAFFGKDIDTPADMSLAIFSNEQGYNGETMGEGDLLIGDNTSGAANLLWDNSTGQLKFRGGTTTQVYIDTDGTLTAGGGAVQLDSTGVTATAGTIAGWSITSDSIVKSGIDIDSSIPAIYVGAGVPQIVIDGANRRIRSSDFSAGVRGFDINASTGDAEFNNIRARGEFVSAVFKVNEIAATAGTLGVFPSASTLTADFTTPAINSTASLHAKNSDAGGSLFGTNDILRIKAVVGGVTKTAWVQVNTVSNDGDDSTYGVTMKSGDVGVTFRIATAVVDYGANGQGHIVLSADGTVGSSANMTIANHAGSPWSATTVLTRLGNLNGEYGASANHYGIGIGNYNSGNGNYLRYNWDGTNTFEIKGGDGVIRLSDDGIEITDTSSSTVSRIRWYYQSKILGYVSGDYGGTGDGVMWMVASKDTGEPWTNVRVVMSAIDNTASPSATRARIDLISDATITMEGNTTLTGTLDTTGDIRTDGNIRLDTEEKSVQFWDSTTSDLMADIISQYADSTAKLWIRAWRQTGDPWTSGSSILLRAKDDVAGTEGALNIESSGDVSTVGWTDYSSTSTITGWQTPRSNTILRYKKIGKLVFVYFYIDGTSNATTTTFTLPYSAAVTTVQTIRSIDNGTTAIGFLSVSGGSSTANFYPTSAGGAWTNSGTKGIYGQFSYQAS